MKIFPPLITAIEQALIEIFVQNRKADKAIGGILKSNPKWGARDRGFIAENTYDIVRNFRKICHCAGLDHYENLSEPELRKLVANWMVMMDAENIKHPLFEDVDAKALGLKLKSSKKLIALDLSLPDWLIEYGKKALPEKFEAEMKAMAEPAQVYLRTNTFKIQKEKLKQIFAEKQIEIHDVKGPNDAIMLQKRMNVFGMEEYKKGYFEVQDAGSQMIAEFLDVKPEHRVIDACAGAGGKALHIATLMQNKGRIIALDIEEHKLIELKTRAKRNGISNIEPRLIEGKTIKRLKDQADRLLLDVPCSGLGVLKRNPDAKWKLRPAFIEEVQITQANILQQYASMLKSGGKMVYATCSIFPAENELQVQKFLANNINFKLLEEKHLWPSETGFDGFYMALIEKTE